MGHKITTQPYYTGYGKKCQYVMTYIDYLNEFNQWLETNALPASSQLMFYKLLHVFNRAGWPEYVGVDNLRLMLMTDTKSEKTVIRARDKLVEAGFITYRKGKKGAPNQYVLCRKHCNNYSIFDSESASISDSESASISASISDSHIKKKTKTKKPSPKGDGGVRNTRFTPPTLEEVTAYVQERGSAVDPQGFIDFYAAKGWMIGKTPMKDWKAACRNAEKWERWGRPGTGKSTPKGTLQDVNVQPSTERIQKNNDWLDNFLAEQRDKTR